MDAGEWVEACQSPQIRLSTSLLCQGGWEPSFGLVWEWFNRCHGDRGDLAWGNLGKGELIANGLPCVWEQQGSFQSFLSEGRFDLSSGVRTRLI
jgi:hypothetical protein